MTALQDPKARKALGWALAAVVVLGLGGVLASDQVATVLSSLFGVAFR